MTPDHFPPHLARVFADLRERERRARDLINVTGLLPCGSTPGFVVFRGRLRGGVSEIEIAFHADGPR